MARALHPVGVGAPVSTIPVGSSPSLACRARRRRWASVTPTTETSFLIRDGDGDVSPRRANVR